MRDTAALSALNVYPVKSCRGVALQRARIGVTGLEHDREWMFVDADGRFVTQRTLPRLALIEPRVSASSLALSAPGMPSIEVDLATPGVHRDVVVWRDTVAAIDQGSTVAEWVSTFMRTPLRLVRFAPGSHRPCNAQYVGDTGAHTRFADAYPLLVVAEASLDDLNARLDAPLPMNRFRPNIVLSGIDAYEEDYISDIAIGECLLKLVKPCTRCQITTTEQSTAEVGVEPLPTLAGHRHHAALDGVVFGVNAVVIAEGTGSLSVGDIARYTLRF